MASASAPTPRCPTCRASAAARWQSAPEELAAAIVYQVGALKAFLDAEGIPLSHIKPHGALYAMAARDERVANAIVDGAAQFDVPLFGLPNTLHEAVYSARGIAFVAEFFVDLEYDSAGHVIITRSHEAVDAERAAERAYRAVTEGLVRSIDGIDVAVQPRTLCIHSDTPNAPAVAASVFERLASGGRDRSRPQ